MRLTTKGRFAVTAMIDVAMHGGKAPVTLAAVSARQRISLSYLEQLFGKLRRSGLVDSVRGPGGGYNLAKAHDDGLRRRHHPGRRRADRRDAMRRAGELPRRSPLHDARIVVGPQRAHFLVPVRRVARATRGPAAAEGRGRGAAGSPPRAGRCAVHARTGSGLTRNPPCTFTECHEAPDLSRLFGDDAGGSARRRRRWSRTSPRNSATRRRARTRTGGPPRPRSRKRAAQVAALVELRPEGNRVDVGRDRVDQPRGEGRRALLQGQGQASRHGPDRAQGHARHDARTRARGLRGDVPRRGAGRPRRPREVQGGAAPGHDRRVGDVRQQRDRRDPGHRRDGRDLPRARHHLPRRRGAGHGQGAGRPREAEGRPDVVLGAQDVRAEGHRRAVRPPQAARAHRGADARRRPRARHALRHAADAPDRRHGRGVPHREGRDGDRERAHPDAARPAVEGPVGRSRRSTSTATWSIACRTT